MVQRLLDQIRLPDALVCWRIRRPTNPILCIARLRGAALLGAVQHAVKIAGIIGIGEYVEVNEEIGAFDRCHDCAQCGEIFNRKADGIKQGNLFGVRAALGFARKNLMEFNDGVIVG